MSILNKQKIVKYVSVASSAHQIFPFIPRIVVGIFFFATGKLTLALTKYNTYVMVPQTHTCKYKLSHFPIKFK